VIVDEGSTVSVIGLNSNLSKQVELEKDCKRDELYVLCVAVCCCLSLS